MMVGLVLLSLVASPLQPPAAPLAEYPYGCVSQPRYSLKEEHFGALELYQPQAGDLIIGSVDNLFWRITYLMALTYRPSHAAVVVERPDGVLVVLESGYDEGVPWTRIQPLDEWRRTYPGVSWIRQRKTPLTAEQKERLWTFALSVDDQPYSILKLAAQLTVFRKRGPIRTIFIGKAIGRGHRYTCVELVMEALVDAGLLPYETTRPGATYPRDMFYDRSINPYVHHHLAIKDSWEVPRWWTRCYVAAP